MSSRVRTVAIELAAFAALAWFAAVHWADGLVMDAPAGRVFACVLIALAAGVAVAVTGEIRSPRGLGLALRLVCVAAALAAAVVAMGLDRSFIAPAHWGEFSDGADRGFAALGSVEWPYDGREPWARLLLLLAIPLVTVPAAVFAFWPGRRLRPLGLVLLAGLYGTAVTEHEFSGELPRGVVLLLLISAWLWLPRMSLQGTRTAAAAAAAVLLACVAALPAAARYEDREPWVDYESWNPFAAQAATRFDWSHSYGPIDWPREGTTLMNVRSPKPHYWKVQTLDYFDGFAWARAGLDRRSQVHFPTRRRQRWETTFRVTIRDLDTNLFPIAGTALAIREADPSAHYSHDGTVETAGEWLDEGDSYFVDAYVPDPTPEQLRAAPDYVPSQLESYTRIFLPPPGTTARDGTGRAGDAARSALATGHIPATRAEILASPYEPVLRLARELAEGEESSYDVVRAVQRHLRSEYRYDERPPRRDFPLAAFLFEDRIGYCQQFSGAMALMLRMLGIPARVAAGFTPGSYNTDTREYRVRDLDAHSWVEVWFEGLGWVPFDPTPSVAPADSQSSADAASASSSATQGGAETQDAPGGGSGRALSERAGPSPETGATGGGSGAEAWLVAAGLALLALAAASARALRRRLSERRSARSHDRELAELLRALARAGQPVPPSLTLRQLEARLERIGGSAAGSYAKLLRERRYSPRGAPLPGAAERRDLRRALAHGRGLRGRVRALSALPPFAFRRG